MGLFFVPFLALGLFFAVMIVREVIASAATYSWQSATCRILESDVRESSDRLPWFAYLRYKWTGGESVRSSRPFAAYSEAARFTRRWAPGSSATCYLDPLDPAGALLERRNDGFVLALFLPLPLLFVLIGGVGLYTTVFRVKLQPTQRKPADPIAGRRFMAGLLIAAGSVLSILFLVFPVRHAIAARSWRVMECKVLRSEVRRIRTSKGSDRFSPLIFYSYVVDGLEHHSDNYSFLDLSTGWDAARRATDVYKRGTTVTCYVNRRDPDDATLQRDPSAGWLVGLIPLLAAWGGLKAWPSQTRPKSAALV